MARSISVEVRRAMRALGEQGFLLLQDQRLPSLATLVAGGPVRGSWWGHRAGARIYDVAGRLEHHADVLILKLIAGKVTFVHRRHWPSLIAVGRGRDRWQMRGLSRRARKLLERVDEEDYVRASGSAARELERSLLVVGREVHTESGAHAKDLLSWRTFARERGIRLPRRTSARGRDELEAAIDAFAAGARASLPWQ